MIEPMLSALFAGSEVFMIWLRVKYSGNFIPFVFKIRIAEII